MRSDEKKVQKMIEIGGMDQKRWVEKVEPVKEVKKKKKE